MYKIGIICPSEIALRRFMPALKKVNNIVFMGIAYANKDEWIGADEGIIEQEKRKAEQFVEEYGAKLFNSYTELIENQDIDSIYIPLPPALHYQWAKKALLAGKNVLLEKPATISWSDTQDLIKIAREKGLTIHENYMFVFHRQIEIINEVISANKLGEIRLIRLSFGFPRRAANDFRYNKFLGGGALLDCGGYPIKYATLLLGETTRITQAQLAYVNGIEVDVYGSAVLENDKNLTAQIAFGMDNSYKCDVEIWGSDGSLFSGRIFTAPETYEPEMIIKIGNKSEVIKLPKDDTFKKSIIHFLNAIEDEKIRLKNDHTILMQAELINQFMKFAKNEENK